MEKGICVSGADNSQSGNTSLGSEIQDDGSGGRNDNCNSNDKSGRCRHHYSNDNLGNVLPLGWREQQQQQPPPPPLHPLLLARSWYREVERRCLSALSRRVVIANAGGCKCWYCYSAKTLFGIQNSLLLPIVQGTIIFPAPDVDLTAANYLPVVKSEVAEVRAATASRKYGPRV